MFLPFAIAIVAFQPKPMLVIEGAFVEACSCKGTCAFETTGTMPGCQALGGYRIDRGSFGGQDVSGTSLAFVCTAAGDVFVYLDAKIAAKRRTGETLARALFGSFGKWKPIQANTEISLVGKGGAYSLLVNNGRTASLTTHPVKGGDGKRFVVLENVHGDPYDRLWQATAKKASFSDKGQSFSLQGSSAFFIDRLSIRKRFP